MDHLHELDTSLGLVEDAYVRRFSSPAGDDLAQPTSNIVRLHLSALGGACTSLIGECVCVKFVRNSEGDARSHGKNRRSKSSLTLRCLFLK